MDANAFICLGSGVFYALKALFKLNFNSVEAILIPSGCGKTSILKNLESNKKSLLIDLDSTALLSVNKEQEERLNKFKEQGENQSYRQEFMVICRDYVEKLKVDFKGKKIIVISSDYELLKYIGVSKSNIHTYVPNNKLFSTLQGDNETNKEMTDNKNEILLRAGKNIEGIYSNFNDLYDMLIRDFNLKQRL